MKHPDFGCVVEGVPSVKAWGHDSEMATVLVSDTSLMGTVRIHGTTAQLLAIAEGIRDSVHAVELERIAAQVEAERAELAEVE